MQKHSESILLYIIENEPDVLLRAADMLDQSASTESMHSSSWTSVEPPRPGTPYSPHESSQHSESESPTSSPGPSSQSHPLAETDSEEPPSRETTAVEAGLYSTPADRSLLPTTPGPPIRRRMDRNAIIDTTVPISSPLERVQGSSRGGGTRTSDDVRRRQLELLESLCPDFSQDE